MGEPLTPKHCRNALNDSLLKKLDALVKEPDKGPTIEDFTIVKPISRGAFGKVFLGYKNTNHEQLYAIKVMRKLEMVNKNMVSQVITERNALLLSRSEFCVSLLYSLETTSYIYLVLEYMVGGDLKSLITMYGYFEEAVAKFYAAEVGCALEFLHAHGIVHRDIKPDNMLIARTGHVKLTDFGLSQLDDHCQAELAAMNRETKSSKYLDARTPGQVFSLTSQFFLASHEKRSIRCDVSNFRERMELNPLNDSSESEHDDTKLSGVSPFFSADDISISIKVNSEEFYTCNSSVGSRKTNGSSSTEGSDENLIKKSFFNCKQKRFKEHREDSGVSSNNKTDEDDKSAKSEEYSEASYGSELTGTPLQSFKRPMCSFKRRRAEYQESSGLTQEIDAMDLGTPKKQTKGDDGTPLKSVLKVRTLADIELKNAHLSNVMASTPVSSQKKRDRCPLGRIKATRFDIPKSTSELMSPIVKPPLANSNPSSNERTPKNMHYVQKRTPKSVRRGVQPSDERILGTPDYLAPELLKMEGHGPEVDWWALGVCLYEFLTGVPPFNDETPERVFQNILNRNIEWPTDDEALSNEAMAAVEQLLTMSPAERPAAKEMHSMKFFEGVNWANITETEPPFVPTLTDPHDTGYFEPRNTMQHLKLSQFDVDI